MEVRVLTDYRLFHSHTDGSFGEMVEHDPAASDPERRWWGKGRLFRCTSCDEKAIIEKPDRQAPDADA